MNKITGIYKITSPSGKVYIGQSKDCKLRERFYRTLQCNKQWKIHYSILKYGWEAHQFEVIHQCSIEELNDLEVYYIELYQCFNTEHGLNLQSGGNRPFHGEETLNKMRLAQLGKYKGRISNRKGVKLSDETKLKISNSKKGKPLSLDHKIKISIGNKGKKKNNKSKN